ncbi:aminopeptidase N-like [Ptychodera flava]|uniref:aminopeptidase N-like n=1 Tax=Ptychodera flava TaxID=63121 RepID=UPI00396A212A
MTTEKTYQVNPVDERNGTFVKYFVLLIAIIVVIVIFIVVILMVYFLHPGWPCPTTTAVNDLPTVTAKSEKLFDGRLPDDLEPVNYRVKFTPYMDEEDGDKRYLIDGEVQITVNCAKSTNTITLHALKLDIDRDTVTVNEVSSGSSFDVRDISVDEEYDFFIIKTATTLERGKEYHISMNYVALMNNSDFSAFYISSSEEGGETRYVMASQLETTYSRRVFPCFDEPALKATLDVIVKHRTKRSALSNMPNIRNETDGDWNTAYFNTTPVMPVYLLSVVVSDFVCKEGTTDNGVKFRVWAPEVDINATELALEVGIKILEHFEELWKIPYSLPKLDMVSVPVFKFGAMENWGLILYKRSRMLYDKDIHPPSRAMRAVRLIAHELAHMWYGNLVTMGWWNVSWLNEGFARHFEFYVVNEVKPEWDIYRQFYPAQVVYKSMDKDASSESHPTEQTDIGWFNDIWTQFDTRVYERGAHMIEMMRSFLGDDIVFDGFRSYLNKHLYGNAFSDDVWIELTQKAKAAGLDIDVKEVMDPWMLQLGFPVVTMSRNYVYSAQVTQRPFKLDPEDDILGSEYFSWYTPLTFVHASNPAFDNPSLTWINGTSGTLNLSGSTSDDWILANVNQRGYYRVNYDTDNWEKLIGVLNLFATTFPVRNRAGLIDDAFNLARSGDVDAVLAFRVIEHLKTEDNLSPWQAAIRNLQYVRDMLETSPSYGNLQSYIRSLVDPKYTELGWDFSDEDTQLEYHLRLDIIKLACELNNNNCVREAQDLYSKWMEDPDKNSIRGDLRATVMCTAIQHGGYEEWKFAYAVFDNTTDYSLQSDIAMALACTPRMWMLDVYLADFLQRYLNESYETKDATEFLTSISTLDDAINIYKIGGLVRGQSAIGFLVTWDFVRRHFDDLRSVNEPSAFKFIWEFAHKMNTEEHQTELEDFARKYNDMPDKEVREFYKALRQVKANIQWMKRNYGDLEEWLK